eukprot:scaffold116117_cov52-Attheya_sp.AAC.6
MASIMTVRRIWVLWMLLCPLQVAECRGAMVRGSTVTGSGTGTVIGTGSVTGPGSGARRRTKDKWEDDDEDEDETDSPTDPPTNPPTSVSPTEAPTKNGSTPKPTTQVPTVEPSVSSAPSVSPAPTTSEAPSGLPMVVPVPIRAFVVSLNLPSTVDAASMDLDELTTATTSFLSNGVRQYFPAFNLKNLSLKVLTTSRRRRRRIRLRRLEVEVNTDDGTTTIRTTLEGTAQFSGGTNDVFPTEDQVRSVQERIFLEDSSAFLAELRSVGGSESILAQVQSLSVAVLPPGALIEDPGNGNEGGSSSSVGIIAACATVGGLMAFLLAGLLIKRRRAKASEKDGNNAWDITTNLSKEIDGFDDEEIEVQMKDTSAALAKASKKKKKSSSAAFKFSMAASNMKKGYSSAGSGVDDLSDGR